ncbi:conserved hypothetical protein [Ricinus communis]|uniref:Reverse transcriptase zinc-binding domain-containing protein n=1 Tax=Ricinus communis TaxID=3988 RepID=B9T496_RICCO|nr:conserved hypothetical protein [Ricinus communis]
MLCKQAWRLLLNPNSLVGQVYKARYYPTGTFLSSKLGANPSFIWASLQKISDVIRRGTRWKIGRGETITIGHHAWLLDDTNGFIQTDLLEEVCRKPVSCLFKTGTFEWDNKILDDLFNDRDKRLIHNIVLSHVAELDRVYWHRDVKGNFSVRDAYRLQQHDLSSSYSGDSVVWSKLWRLNITSKCKIFMWRALLNILPTRVNLVTKKKDDHRAALFVVICWSLWLNKNDYVWNGKKLGWKSILNRASTYLFQWGKARRINDFQQLRSQLVGCDSVWHKPVEGWYKMNVDASFSEHSRMSGAGFVLRDSAGAWVSGTLIPYPYISNPQVAELGLIGGTKI